MISLFLLLGAVPAGTVDAWAAERARTLVTAPPDVSPRRLYRTRPRGEPLPGFSPPRSLAPLVQSVTAGVVSVRTQNAASVGDETPVEAPVSRGSGFILSAEGFVVTNHHVVEDAQAIRVALADDREFPVEVVGSDPVSDVALLRVEGPAPGLPSVYLGDSDALEVGDWVLAVGNPLGFDHSVAHGLVSAVGRELSTRPGLTQFIQTDAPINRGNSGGPLFNMRGEVVGVVTAAGNGDGLGFAVPINLVKDLLPNLLENGRVERGWLGASVRSVPLGVFVRAVAPGGPAERAGLKPGDRLLALNGRPVQSYRALLRKLSVLGPGTALKLSLQRGAAGMDVKVTLGERPDDADEER
jgi:serine protease Do